MDWAHDLTHPQLATTQKDLRSEVQKDTPGFSVKAGDCNCSWTALWGPWGAARCQDQLPFQRWVLVADSHEQPAEFGDWATGSLLLHGDSGYPVSH